MPARRLAAVMVTDMVGFTALMKADQNKALTLVGRGHTIIQSLVSKHDGEWLEDPGDRSVAAFPSAFNAVTCALEIQGALKKDPELKLRIGVDFGDVIMSEGHVYGNTVITASFIERLADPDGLVITESVFEEVRAEIDLDVIDLGEKVLKNAGHSVRLYALSGAKQKSWFGNVAPGLMVRRVPHIVGAYLAAGWAVIEVTEWLAGHGVFDSRWVFAVMVGLLALIPSVLLVSYFHGAHGRDQFAATEKIVVPLNLLIAAIFVAFTFQNTKLENRGEPISPASVAVLPFINLSDDPDNQYFSSGLSEELINALAKIPEMYVASRTSSFIFDKHDNDPRDIAKKLRVATILEGSVRKQGNKVRVTAQLIDGKENFHLWTETYDRDLTNIFEIQEDIALAVTSKLVAVLRPETETLLANTRAATLEAYDYYLRGLSYLRQPISQDSLANARELLRRAVEEDAGYAQAYAALCEVSLEQYTMFQSPSFIDLAEVECQKALSLDDTLREVRFARGVLARNTGNYAESARIFQALLNVQPSARAWVGLGETKEVQGNYDEAEVAFQNAIDMEPGNWHNSIALGEFLYWRGDYQKAITAFQRVIRLSPDNARAYLLMGACYDYLGDTDESLRATLKSIELSPTRGAYRDLGLTYYYLRDYEKAADAYKRAIELGPDDYRSWGNLAHNYMFLDGQADASTAAYEKAAELAAAVLERNENDWLTLANLAVYNVMNGSIQEGIQQISIAVAEGSHVSEVHYYDAVIHLRLGQQQETIDALERAIELGTPTRMIARDPEFEDLKDDNRFRSIIEE